jgi:hypothetical protein
VVLLVASLAVLPATPAFAGRKKTIIAGTVDGDAMKWKGRYASITQNPEVGVFIIATKRARPGKILPTIAFGCAVNLLAQTQFPLTMTLGCTANYTETRVGGSEGKLWLALGESTTITFETFDGTRVTGHMTSMLDPAVGADGPITIDVTFSGKVLTDAN